MQNDPAFTFVLFGGTGDLSMRKLLPALLTAHRGGKLHADGKILFVAQQVMDRATFIDSVRERVGAHLPANDAVWESFLDRLDYLAMDAFDVTSYLLLAERLQQASGVRVFYLATAPALFEPICVNLAASGIDLTHARVVLEKPLGTDLASSRKINDAVARVFTENQIYRIDHYLGKESVQNLMALRFANSLFEPLWRREWISDVQITIAEELVLEGRGGFYDDPGALRHRVHHHFLPLPCIIAMEPPTSFASVAVRTAEF